MYQAIATRSSFAEAEAAFTGHAFISQLSACRIFEVDQLAVLKTQNGDIANVLGGVVAVGGQDSLSWFSPLKSGQQEHTSVSSGSSLISFPSASTMVRIKRDGRVLALGRPKPKERSFARAAGYHGCQAVLDHGVVVMGHSGRGPMMPSWELETKTNSASLESLPEPFSTQWASSVPSARLMSPGNSAG